MPRVTLASSHGLPSRTADVTNGSTLLKAVLRGRQPIGRSCRGTGVCAACAVRVVEGAENLDGPTPLESALLASHPLPPDGRYACLARLRGSCTVTTDYW